MKTFEPSFASAAWDWRSALILHLARVLGILTGCAVGCMVVAGLALIVVAACVVVPPLLCARYAAHRNREGRAEGTFATYRGESIVFPTWNERRS